MKQIAGAGLAGLLAAHAWPQAEVFEAQEAPRAAHRALLRFRTQEVAKQVGIEFQPVTVRKGVWLHDRFVEPDVRLANWYSHKMLGTIEAERSIWNLDPVQRFIAPETLYEQLVEAVGKRILWGTAFPYRAERGPVVSTAPLPAVLTALYGSDLPDWLPKRFTRAPIRVERYRVPRCSVYQSVYFPHPEQVVYRASITGDLLIVECANAQAPTPPQLEEVFRAFGLRDEPQRIDIVDQKYGKIVPLPSAERGTLLGKLTIEHSIFSLGRFATWRNVLLDDVVTDIAVIRRLLRSSEYEHRLHFNRNT